jgi:hypothetical protein
MTARRPVMPPPAPTPPLPRSSVTQLYGEPRRFKQVSRPSGPAGAQTAAIPRGKPSRSEKCGHCRTCLHPRWKQACVSARTHSIMRYAVTRVLGHRTGPSGKRQLLVAWSPGWCDADMVDAPLLVADYDARCAAPNGTPDPSNYSDLFPPDYSNSSDADPSVASDSTRSTDEQTSDADSAAGDADTWPSWVGFRVGRA